MPAGGSGRSGVGPMAAEGSTDPWPRLRALPLGEQVEFTDGNGSRWTGTVIPPHELTGDRILTLKLGSGYNVGLLVDPRSSFRVLAHAPPPKDGVGVAAVPPPADSGLAVALLTTGGTIASRVDYETGGVRPVGTEAEILAFYPELRDGGPVRLVPVRDVLSENLVPADWLALAEKVVEAFRAGAPGVVVSHGTDTMGFTAAALSFLLVDLPGPVVLVGAQRSPDRPSSDGPSNLAAAVLLARDRRLGEVVVVMHAGLSDDRFAIHRAPWVRKMHASRRDAFESRNGPPIGTIEGTRVTFPGPVRAPSAGPPRVDGPLDPRAGLLQFYPGLSADRARAFAAGLRGLVLAGTGLGHVAAEHLGWIREATARGVVVAMTTQCLGGTVDPYVYATGRELLRSGVLYLDDLLPETAYAKMLWALGHASDPAGVASLLRADRAGEFLQRRPPAERP